MFFFFLSIVILLVFFIVIPNLLQILDFIVLLGIHKPGVPHQAVMLPRNMHLRLLGIPMLR